jgi:hypothetical protein
MIPVGIGVGVQEVRTADIAEEKPRWMVSAVVVDHGYEGTANE